jgi:hypothetical protein
MTTITNTENSGSHPSQAKVRVTLKRTINLQDYNSMAIEFMVEDYVPEGSNPGQFIDKLYAGVQAKLIQKMTDEGIIQ